jgi:hypothetical protein
MAFVIVPHHKKVVKNGVEKMLPADFAIQFRMCRLKLHDKLNQVLPCIKAKPLSQSVPSDFYATVGNIKKGCYFLGT